MEKVKSAKGDLQYKDSPLTTLPKLSFLTGAKSTMNTQSILSIDIFIIIPLDINIIT